MKKESRISVVSFTLAMMMVGASADFMFTVKFPLFSTNANMLQRTVPDAACCVCCEDSASLTCPSFCNATILVCIREADHPFSDNGCPLGTIVEPIGMGLTELSGTFEGTWEGIAQVSFTVFHYDPEALQSVGVVTASSLDLLDSIFINSVSLPPSDPPTPDTPFVGSFGRISVVANFQVVCASGFFGADCSATCETRDDGLGHFTCDPVSGGRVCLEGYTGVEGNCTECETSPGCSPIGGVCNEPGECICLSGFSGENCSESLNGSTTSQLPSSFGFTSTTQTIQPPTSTLPNLVTSTAGLPSTPSLSTVTLQTSTTSLASVEPSPVMELPSSTQDPAISSPPASSPPSSIPASPNSASQLTTSDIINSMLSPTPVTSHGELDATTTLPPGEEASIAVLDTATLPPTTSSVEEASMFSATITTGSGTTDQTLTTSSTPPVVGLNRGNGRTLYIIVGAVVGGAVVFMVASIGFALIMGLKHRHYQRKAIRQQGQRNESRFTDVIPNIGSSSRFSSVTTLNKHDPYLDTIAPPEEGLASGTFPRPTYDTFQQREHMQTQERAESDADDDADAGYATPNVVTRSTVHTPDPEQGSYDKGYATLSDTIVTTSAASLAPEPEPVKEHEYAVLEAQDLTIEGQGVPEPEDVVTTTEAPSAQDDTLVLCEDLLESIEKTMTHITMQLEDESTSQSKDVPSNQQGYSFIYADEEEEEEDTDSVLQGSSMSPVSMNN